MSQREDNGQSYESRYEQQRGYGGGDEPHAQGSWDERRGPWNDRPGWRDQSGRDQQHAFGQRTHWREPFQYRGEQPGGSRYREGTSAGHYPREQYGHEHSSSEEMFGRRAFSAPEETQYYGTGSAGYGGPGFTGGAYAYGNGPRDQERPLESEYSDESAVSYERPGYGRFSTSRSGRYAGNPYGQRSYYGTGPKGYQRSDDRLKEDISERLTEAHHIDASDVSVDVRAAKVVLEGTVPSRHMKHAIEDLADACPGVQDVDNRVRVASRDELARRSLQSSQQTTATAGAAATSVSGSAGATIPGGTRSRQ